MKCKAKVVQLLKTALRIGINWVRFFPSVLPENKD